MNKENPHSQEKIARSSLRLLAARLARHKAELAIGFLALVFVDVLQLAVPKLVQYAIDALARGTASVSNLWLLGGGVVAIAVAIGFGRFAWRYFILGASHKIARDLRQDLYEHHQTLSPEYYDRNRVGDIMAHASNDIQAVRMATGIAALASFDALFLGSAAIAVMCSMNLPLTLLTLIPLPVLTVVMIRFGSVVHRRFTAVQAAFSHLTEKAQESFSGIRVVKAYGGTDLEERSFSQYAACCVNENIKLARVWSLFGPFISGLALASAAILLGAGGRMVILGRVSLGTFVAFSGYLSLLIWPLMAVGWVINLLQRGTASMNRLQKLFFVIPAVKDGHLSPPLESRIEVRNLTFTYPGFKEPVLRDLSFTIPAGSTVGIVGATGSGKTTLVELLMRLYDPPPRSVLVGGTDVRELELSGLRSLFGYVPQEPFLFSMSVAGNIAFGVDDLSREEIRRLARTVEIHEEVLSFPEGYDTRVGERGVTLSGGQRQRIALARALARKPRILVLDDALSSCDAETERAILRRLKEGAEERTTILIAHRISTVREADMILVLERGRPAEAGTHEELVSREGFYAELFRLQELEARARGTREEGL